MKRAPKKFRKNARVLMDPEPKFVSIVKAGANMTPLLAVKRAGELQEDDMKITAKRSADHDIAELRFDKAKFADVTAVSKWLESGGYSEYDVIDAGELFVVKGLDGLTDLREVASPDGVTSVVGKRPEEAVKAEADPAVEAEAASAVVKTKAEEAAPAADESEPISKDEAPSEQTDEEAVKAAVEEVVKAARKVRKAPKEEPKVEPKVEEAAAAAEATSEEAAKEEAAPAEEVKVEEAVQPVAHAKADEILKEARSKGLYEIMDVGAVLYTMAYLVQDADYSGLPPEKVTEVRTAAQNMLDVLDWFMQNSLDSFGKLFNNPPQENAPEVEVTLEKTEEAAAEAAPEQTAEKAAETPTEPNAEIVALSEKIELLAAVVEKLASAASQKASGEDDGVKPERQTRKGADVSDAKPEPKKVSKEVEEFNAKMTRSLLGF